MTKAEQFAELNSIHWHIVTHIKQRKRTEGGKIYYDERYECTECGTRNGCNPTFTDAKSILEAMMKRNDWEEFVEEIGGGTEILIAGVEKYIVYIGLFYILNSEKLLNKAIKFCEESGL